MCWWLEVQLVAHAKYLILAATGRWVWLALKFLQVLLFLPKCTLLLFLFVIFPHLVATICAPHFPIADNDIYLLFVCLIGDLGYETCMQQNWSLWSLNPNLLHFSIGFPNLTSSRSRIPMWVNGGMPWDLMFMHVLMCFWANVLLFLLVSTFLIGATSTNEESIVVEVFY